MNKTLYTFASIALFSSALALSAPKTEAEVYAYRVAMKEAGDALKQQQPKTAFNKIKPMAEKGFAEAQYILATLYHDGEGTAQNLTEAKKWYTAAATQTENAEVASLAKEGLSELQ